MRVRPTVFAIAAFAVVLAGAQPARAATHYSWGTFTYTPPTWPVPLQGDLWGPDPSPAGSYACVAMMHGGGFAVGDRTWNTPASTWLADNGYVVFNFDYRLDDPAAGGWLYPAPENDARQAVNWMHGLGYCTKGVDFMGTSSGAVVAEELAVRGDWATVFHRAVAWSGMGQLDHTESRMTDHLGCDYATCPSKWNAVQPCNNVDATDKAIYVAHSTGDPNIAYWTDRNFMLAPMGGCATAYSATHTFYNPTSSLHGTDFLSDATAKAGTLSFLGGL